MFKFDLEKRKKDRCNIERLAKFVTWVLVMGLIIIGSFFGLNSTLIALVSTTVWFLIPDITAYVLEILYHTEHRTDTYR